jgi:FlaA1/EpsC-like NDP-sugar epimerase
VTGAGGSIGSEICRQVASFDPQLLVLVDHDDTHLHDVASATTGRTEEVLADVARRDAVFGVFESCRPEVVFHAAALKHVPILETHVVAAVTTNVIGTANVLDAALASGTERFVLVSTDKAVRPSSVMGATKRVGEQLLQRSALGRPYCAVRFGNVMGSRGSVIPTFQRQIDAGGPVTVTDPDMTRYFMSVEEAVQLVLQASVLAGDGDVYLLEMGEPQSILELARRMIRLSGLHPGTDIPIRIIGARPGEKLHEELHDPDERLGPTEHPAIVRLAPPGAAADGDRVAQGYTRLVRAVTEGDEAGARRILFDLVREPAPGSLRHLPPGPPAPHRHPLGDAVPA